MNVPSATGAVLAGTAMFLVGSMAGVGVLITDYPVYGGQAIRYAVAAGIFLAILGISDRLSDRRTDRTPGARRLKVRTVDVVGVAMLAVVGLAAFNVFKLATIRHAGPVVAGTVLAAVPIVLAVVAPLARGRRPSARVGTGAVIVTAGAVLTTGYAATDALGAIYALAMLGCEAGFTLLAVPLIARFGPLRTSTYAAIASVPELAVVALVADGTGVLRMPTMTEALAFAYIAVVVTVIAFLCWYSALARLGADRAGLFAGLMPVGAILAAVVVGVDFPSYQDLFGVAVVIGGLLYGFSGTGRNRPRHDAGDSSAASGEPRLKSRSRLIAPPP